MVVLASPEVDPLPRVGSSAAPRGGTEPPAAGCLQARTFTRPLGVFNRLLQTPPATPTTRRRCPYATQLPVFKTGSTCSAVSSTIRSTWSLGMGKSATQSAPVS